MQIRFHLDESVHLAVAEGLRRRGINVTVPAEVGLRQAKDTQHLAFAHGQGRVVITHDIDFLRLAQQKLSHSGIAFCANQARTVGQMIRSLEALWLTRDAEEVVGHVEFI